MMLSICGPHSQIHGRVARRELIRVGSLGLAGLGLPQLLSQTSRAALPGAPAVGRGKAKSCILLFLMGGPPQHSTWDPKPEAPAEVRGEIGACATNIAGVQFGELMPLLAARADKLCVLRAVSTGDNAHSSSGYYMLTGRPHSPMNAENANPGPPNDWPNVGSIVNSLTTPRGPLPQAVRLPSHIFNTDGSVWPGQDAGFLGRKFDPWLFRCQPAAADFRVPEFHVPVELSSERLLLRNSLLGDLNKTFAGAERCGVVEHYDTLTQRAYDLLTSPEARRAFDLQAEPETVRQRYGSTQFGQSVLLGPTPD
jgi:hypothetical protein